MILVGLLAVACGPATAVGVGVGAQPSSAPVASPTSVAIPPGPGIPIKLRIPSLGINSPTIRVGLVRGAVGTPCDPTKPWAPCNTNATAWYDGSVRPGQAGDAVEDSHVDWYGPVGSGHDIPAVFSNLNRIRLGAKVIVIDKLGASRTFVVDRITILPYPQQPANTYATDGPARLTLITCAGIYVNTTVGMNQRLYVRATLA